MSTQSQHPIYIDGSGNSARITALALASAGLPVALHAPARASAKPTSAKSASTNSKGDIAAWQRVLALSPSSRNMLEVLGVWSVMAQPSSPITAPIIDMHVYGATDAAQHILPPHLNFADPTDDAPNEAANDRSEAARLDAPLGHIVSLDLLSAAIDARLSTQDGIDFLPAPIADFDPSDGAVRLADETPATGTPGEGGRTAAILVDTQSATAADFDTRDWRAAQNRRALRHDYQASAVVACLKSARPHGQMAQQIFLPDGPLALLPLPQPDRVALVWTLPNRRATALVAAANRDAGVLAHELRNATQERFGALQLCGAAASQPLTLYLAEAFNPAPHCVVLGEAAHIIHPLAGQGFNLTLRDAAQLTDTLFEARRLGLALSDATALRDYAVRRQSAARAMVAATHGLSGLFGTDTMARRNLAALARSGLAGLQALAQRRPTLRQGLRRAANGEAMTPNAISGGSKLPPYLRGENY